MRIYVTFGQTHAHSVNGKTLDKDTVAVFEALDDHQGRCQAFEYFGDKFFTTYTEENWNEEHFQYYPKGYVFI